MACECMHACASKVERQRDTHRETDRRKERERDRQTDRHRDGDTETEFFVFFFFKERFLDALFLKRGFLLVALAALELIL